jgi:hypothetical protein
MPIDDATGEASGATNEECLEYIRSDIALKRQSDEDGAIRREARKRAKAAGVPTVEAALVARLAKLEKPEAVQFLRNVIRLAHLRQIIAPTQLDLLGNVDLHVANSAREEFDVAMAQERGYRDGRAGVSTDDNPFPIGSGMSAEWVKWLKRGAAAKARELGPDAKQATASKANPRDEAEPKKAAAKKRLAIAGPAAPAKKKGRPAGAKDKAPRKMARKARGNGAQQHAA